MGGDACKITSCPFACMLVFVHSLCPQQELAKTTASTCKRHAAFFILTLTTVPLVVRPFMAVCDPGFLYSFRAAGKFVAGIDSAVMVISYPPTAPFTWAPQLHHSLRGTESLLRRLVLSPVCVCVVSQFVLPACFTFACVSLPQGPEKEF